MLFGTPSRNRTGMPYGRQILSLLCLPIPPPERTYIIRLFPIDYSKTKEITQHNLVYNLIIDKDHIVYINDIQVCTLGHNLTDNDVIKHDYFGTQEVIRDYEKIEGYEQGRIVLEPNMNVRDPSTGCVCGLS